MNSASSPVKILLSLFGVCFILLGFCLLIKAFNAPIPPLWLSAIFMIAGLAVLGPSEPKLQNIFGIFFLGMGTFLALRSIDIITRPWLHYGLGALFIFGGVALVIYSATGGARQHKRPENK